MKTIKLTNSKKRAKVDNEDYEWLNQFKWRLSIEGYAVTTVDGRDIFMHDMIVAQMIEHN